MRRLVILLAGLLVLLGGLASAAVLFRVPLAEAVIENRLAAYGLDSLRLQIASLGREQALVVAVTAGENDELQARSVAIRYDLARLFDGAPLDALEEVVIEGLTLRLDLTGQGPPLGSLQELLAGDRDQAGDTLPKLPPVTLQDARIEAATPLGQIAATLEGMLGPTADGRITTSLALSAEGGPGQLEGTLYAEAGPDGTATGSLVLDEGRLQVTPAEGASPLAVEDLSGALAFTLEAWRPVVLTGDFTAEGLRHPGGTQDRATLKFDVTETSASAEMHFAAADGLLKGRLTLAVDDYITAPTIEARLTAEADAAAGLLDLLPPPRATAGSGSLDLRLAGRLAPFAEFGKAPPSALSAPPALQPLAAWLGQGDLTLDSRLALAALALPEVAQGIGASLAAKAALDVDTVQLALTEDASLSIAEVDPALLAGLGLPADAVALLRDGGNLVVKTANAPQLRLEPSGAGLALRLAATADIALAGPGSPSASIEVALTGTAESFTGTAAVTASAERIEAGGNRIAQAEVHLPLAIERDAESLRLSLTAPGHLSAARLERDGLDSRNPAATLESGWLTVSLGAAGAAGFEHAFEVRPKLFTLTVPGAREPIALDLGPLSLSGRTEAGAAYEGTAQLSRGAARFEEPAVTFDELSGEARFDASFTQVTADLAAVLTSHDEPALLVPLTLAVRLVRDGPALRLAGQAEPKDATPETAGLRLPITARYDLDKGRGQASLAETTLSFVPGGLQPSHLLPSLADLANVAGEAKVAASLALGSGAPKDTGQLNLLNLSFRSGSNQVSGLDLALTLDSLQPPASPPGQRLSIARLDSVLPIEDIEVIFQVPAAEQPQVRLSRLVFTLAGGRFEAGDTLLMPGAARPVVPGAITFDVTGLELAPLFEALSVQGLTGRGTLDGRIPIALEGEEVAVDGGHLESRTPGTLSYRSLSLRSSLPPDADDLALLQSPVDLAILALGNFHYDRLTLELDKEAAGETELKLHVEGKNPDLLGGYPFVFNINLKGNLNPLIAALRQGATISDEMIRRTWKAAP